MTSSDRPASGWMPPASRRLERDGRSPLERYAIARLRADVAAMPASEIVQLVLWPHTVADWARDAQVAPAVVYNLLSRFKPYRRVRDLLALRLEVPVAVLDHLVDAPRPLPAAQRAPAMAPPHDGPTTTELAPPPAPPDVDEWRRSGGALPAVRDGTNPLELRAVFHAWRDTAALPASLLVQLALFPETLAVWARRRRIGPSLLYGVLAGTQRHPGVREALARQLGLSTAAIDHAIDAPRAEPSRPAAMPLADAPRVDAVTPDEDAPLPPAGPSDPGSLPASSGVAQLSLGL
ncbi:MAG: hypothetical protein ACYC2G_00195 [Gemmatimonadaceae bacterium]